MEYKRPYRIFALLMASMMLLTSFTYSLSLHYCQGEIMGVSLMNSTNSCHEMSQKCAMHQGDLATEEEKKNCCQNEQVIIEDIVHDYPGVTQLSLENLQFLVAYVYVVTDAVPVEIDQTPIRTYRPPPLLAKNLQVLHQTFLL